MNPPALPPALIEIALDSHSTGEAMRLKAGLTASHLRWWHDHEAGQFVMAGPDEQTLDDAIHALRASGIGFDVGAPMVAYREGLGRAATVTAVHSRIIGPKGEFAKVVIAFAAGTGAVFTNQAPAHAVPAEFVPAVEAALAEACARGLLAGFPVIDLEARLIDGAHHDIDSSPAAFRAATLKAFQSLRTEAEPQLLEPIMQVAVQGGAEAVDEVTAALRLRRGYDIENRGNRVSGLAPLANLFGWPNALRARFGDAIRLDLTFDHYAPLPRNEGPPPPTTAMARQTG